MPTSKITLGTSGPQVLPFALGCMGMGAERTSSSSARPSPVGVATRVLLSVKFGGLRGPDGAFLGYDARPAATKNFLAHSLSRLGVDHIDIYRPARLDPAVPIEDTIGAIADMVKAGYVRYIGLSEVGVETIRRAAKVHAGARQREVSRAYSAAPTTCAGQAAIWVTKQVPDVVSQQFELPLAAAGQLFWQSLFAVHEVTHTVPPPLLEPLPLLLLDGVGS